MDFPNWLKIPFPKIRYIKHISLNKIYPHRIQHFHNHAGCFWSLVLWGSYTETRLTDTGERIRSSKRAGQINYVSQDVMHRVKTDQPCYTLHLTGPQLHVMSFHFRGHKVRWQELISADEYIYANTDEGKFKHAHRHD